MVTKKKLDKPGYGVMSINKGERRYYYLRVPAALQQFYTKKLCLSGATRMRLIS